MYEWRQVKTLKYLGVHIDPNLSWHHHINELTAKTKQRINQINWIMGKYWGLNPRNSTLIYKTAIEPALLYAVPVWQEALDNIHIKKRLLSVQRQAAIKITKAYRTAPTDALLAIAGLTPIHITAKSKAWQWIVTNTRIWGKTTEEINKNIRNKLIPKNIKEISENILTTEIDKIDNSISLEIHPAESMKIKVSLEYENKKDKDYQWLVYTDGSRQTEGAGAGIYITKTNSKVKTYQANFKIANHCTITQAELWAIYKALIHIRTNLETYKGSIKFYIDSRVALQTLRKEKNIPLLAVEIIREAHKIADNNNLFFSWIPAHQGIKGNEMADFLAKRAVTSDSKITYKRIPMKELKKQMRNWEVTTWQKEWENSTTGRHCFQFFPIIKDRLRNKHYKISHETTQILTNHGSFQAYLYRFKISRRKNCDCDEESEGDANHLLFDCKKYEQSRQQFFRQCMLHGIRWRTDQHRIINNKEVWESLEQFITKTGTLLPDYSKTKAQNTVQSQQSSGAVAESDLSDNQDNDREINSASEDTEDSE
ncbi:uncharacterized protein LOC111621079 [Centruroides sculpturatus]|uniref:uncharacterized protein LOC111621079 n=1 Tax=Centruroides sculpturatus TaxID=218467 RepID=UPI000C6D986F|nr:uncharacterized protein LOC111621079 [Centruroides sculpturatus]